MEETETLPDVIAGSSRAHTALSRIVLGARGYSPPFLGSLEALFAATVDSSDDDPDASVPDGTENLPPEAAPPERDKPPESTEHHRWHHKFNRGHWLFSGAAVLAVIVFLLVFYCPGRVLPGVQLAGRSAYGADQAKLERIVQQQTSQIRLGFIGEGKRTAPTLQQAGIQIDQSATVKSALLAKRGGLERFMFWRTRNIALIYTIDQAKLDRYLQQHYPDQYRKPKDASISYNADAAAYDILPSEPGQGIDTKALQTKLQASMYRPAAIHIGITSLPTPPVIDDKIAQKAQAEANKYLADSVVLTHRGNTVFTFEPHEIQRLLDITSDTARKKIVVRPNTDKIRRFIEQDVTNAVTQPPRDQISIVSGGTTSVIQHGVTGRQLADNAKLADKVAEAFKNHAALSEELLVIEKPFNTRSVTGTTRWIDVNLSTQTTRLMLDDSVVASFRISSGRAATPTDVGEHAIRSKFPKQTMSGTINGESYYVPNIPWVSYFNADAEAFHGTYWHSSFGTPMSHGCINMTIADAKTLYDYAPIGTRVSVHY